MPEQFEKVEKGLEWAKAHPERDREYRMQGYDGKAVIIPLPLAEEALSLLKTQEPRLVTKEDFKNADKYGWLPVWSETKDDLYCECIEIDALDAMKEEGCRYWTSRPTDEQRKAVEWDE